MPVPINPIGRRQVLKALAAIPVLGTPLNLAPRHEPPASSDAVHAVEPDARHRPPHAHRALIGVL
jgi:hypothetical protein